MSQQRNFISKLFLGKNTRTEVECATSKHCQKLKDVWENQNYNDFGLERIIRLFLILFQFVSIGLYVKAIFGFTGLVGRKISVEIYILLKLLFPILCLLFDFTNSGIVVFLCFYFNTDTIVYLFFLLMLSDKNSQPIGYKRSLFSLFINYLEIALNFAVIYTFYNKNEGFLNHHFKNNFEAVYFSFVTTSTIGYGDFFPVSVIAQFLVVIQIILFFVFIGLFFNFFASRIDSKTYFNSPK